MRNLTPDMSKIYQSLAVAELSKIIQIGHFVVSGRDRMMMSSFEIDLDRSQTNLLQFYQIRALHKLHTVYSIQVFKKSFSLQEM